ncbi:MAG TPA: S8 family peptidase [Bacillota bacterium]|nr:S8 family peptidase [Bacillota bacterium]
MKNKRDKLLVTFTEEQDYLQFYRNLPKQIKKRIKSYHHWHSVSILDEDYEQLKDRFPIETNETPKKVYIETNIPYRIHQISMNDQIIPWGISSIKAPEAWSNSQGQGIKIGIIDTGIDATHPDLRGRMFGGINTADKTSPFVDPNGHGTHIAGIIAAINNHFGVVGVAPLSHLYSIKAFRADGTALLTDLADAIHWAMNENIQILNMSFGSSETSVTLQKALQAALRHGVIMVASAGNNGKTVDYPAKYSEVFAVGAIQSNKKVAEFSSHGKELNYVAPGVDILSTWPVSPYYNSLSGTSMAAPHISAICALLLTQKNNLTPAQVKSILDQSAVKLPGVSSHKQGKGVVMASKAVGQLNDRI